MSALFPLKLTLDKARELVNRAIQIKGIDYVYTEDPNVPRHDEVAGLRTGDPACMYFLPDGEPGCIVGHVLAGLDVRRGHLTYTENESTSVPGIANAPEYVTEYRQLLDVDSETATWLLTLQAKQDFGASWGEALKAADDALETRRSFENQSYFD